MHCRFCGEPQEAETAEYDPQHEGFWCGWCDGYTYLDDSVQPHRFTLLLEERQSTDTAPLKVDVAFDKRLSPLRYPGGKSKFIPYIYSKLREDASQTLVGAYAGGASAELALLQSGVVEHLVLNDLDYGIYALYWMIQHHPDKLIRQILQSEPTHEDFFLAREKIKSDYKNCTLEEAAWALLMTNRLAYSGIYKANPLGGRNGSIQALRSRWSPVSLCKRIEKIHRMSDRMTVLNQDACDLIEEYYWYPQTTIFVDPPYVQKGAQLYHHFYDEEAHVRLNVLLDYLHQGMPGADIILCYDHDPLVERLYLYPEVERVGRVYSV